MQRESPSGSFGSGGLSDKGEKMIRKVTQNDRELFVTLSEEFFSSDAVYHSIPTEFHEKSFDELMRSDEYIEAFILERDGAPAGYALIAKTFSHEAGGKVVWIEELYVREQYRGHGLGKAFFAYMDENCPAARHRLEIEPDNVRAKKLYSSLGYEKLPYAQMIKGK